MTRHEHPELLNSTLQVLTDEGSEAFAASLGIFVDEAMRAERSAVLQARAFRAHGGSHRLRQWLQNNDPHPRIGPITFAVPQDRCWMPGSRAGDLDCGYVGHYLSDRELRKLQQKLGR